MSRKRPSGSPTAWSERRKAYKATQRQVSNPGQPSPCNRRARRKPKTVGTLNPQNGMALLAVLASLAVEGGADPETLKPILEPTDEF